MPIEQMNKWDQRFLDLAKFISEWSLDPSCKVGAVITDGKRLVSIGFNGLAQNVKDSKERLNNREIKLKCILHAEVNAILLAGKDLIGTTIYVAPFMPCASCASHIIQVGIKRVVSYNTIDNGKYSRWLEDWKLAQEMFNEAGIELVLV